MRLARILFCGLFALPGVIALGCRYDWSFEDESKDGGNGKDANGGGGDSSERDVTSFDVDPLPEAEPPPPAECKQETKCGVGNYCAFSDAACGTKGGAGKCLPVSSPPCVKQLVCACNGAVTNVCDARNEGLDLDQSWAICKTSPQFKCGNQPVLCNRGTQYCQVKATGVGTCIDMKGCTDGCGCPEPSATKAGCGGTCNDKVVNEPAAIFIQCP